MGTIFEALKHAYATIALVPIIPFLIVYFVISARGGDRKQAIRTAMDVTTVFLIGIVAALINDRFGTTFGLYLLILLMLIGGGLIGNAQNRARGKVDTSKLIRAVWRLSFFGMSVLYIILMFVQILVAIGKAVQA
ncbi:DUF3397 domain-containing protein [Cohnella sp. GCM10027633]|uniref:DUF3397 domain-containing protein n=1 Tax=unclassified Cohnella TaxID=2636738 RepID=UPI003631F184